MPQPVTYVEITPLARELLARWQATGVAQHCFERAVGLRESALYEWTRDLAAGATSIMALRGSVPRYEAALERARVWVPARWQIDGRRVAPATRWHCDDCYSAGNPKRDHPRCEWCGCLAGDAHEAKRLVWHEGWRREYVRLVITYEAGNHRVMAATLEAETEYPWAFWWEGWACEWCAGIRPRMYVLDVGLVAARCDAPVGLLFERTGHGPEREDGEWGAEAACEGVGV